MVSLLILLQNIVYLDFTSWFITEMLFLLMLVPLIVKCVRTSLDVCTFFISRSFPHFLKKLKSPDYRGTSPNLLVLLSLPGTIIIDKAVLLSSTRWPLAPNFFSRVTTLENLSFS